MKKNILVLGSGGREYAMAWKLSNDKNIKDVYCIPGNAGTSKIAINHSLDLSNHQSILDFVNKNEITQTDLTLQKKQLN